MSERYCICALNEKQRAKIVEKLQISKNDFLSYQNLDLLTAVYDSQKKFYLTRAYYLSPAMKRTGDTFSDYKYVILKGNVVFVVSCIEENGQYKNLTNVLGIGKKNILDAIYFYDDSWTERRRIAKKEAVRYKTTPYEFSEWYLVQNEPILSNNEELILISAILFVIASFGLIRILLNGYVTLLSIIWSASWITVILILWEIYFLTEKKRN